MAKKGWGTETGFSGAGLIDLRDAGMVETAKSLRLRLNRRSNSRSAQADLITFSATLRRGWSCSATLTAPIPPSPSRPMMW